MMGMVNLTRFLCVKCGADPKVVTMSARGWVCSPNCEQEAKRSNKVKMRKPKSIYKPAKDNKKEWRCQFCDKLFTCVMWFGKEWACLGCIKRLGLEEHEAAGEMRGGLQKQKVKIEEVPFVELSDGAITKPTIEPLKMLPAPRKMNLSEMGLAPRPPNANVYSSDWEDMMDAMRESGKDKHRTRREEKKRRKHEKGLPPIQVEKWY